MDHVFLTKQPGETDGQESSALREDRRRDPENSPGLKQNT